MSSPPSDEIDQDIANFRDDQRRAAVGLPPREKHVAAQSNERGFLPRECMRDLGLHVDDDDDDGPPTPRELADYLAGKTPAK